ncbi:glycosyltransferase family 4 protein [Curvibacter sp. PAE-UM]|uniref:glycosyltransferase family 4 protein n=1 Tax=Curvibacter sp. PAE-UM TaxID=1714344 RepID=UPI00070BF39C|nr:glycosyltransferase family 4 protein [Curvibacter sp. PAE-UM]KRI01752.1 glycosyl transferase [Curvibacter sp. PAE-UM]
MARVVHLTSAHPRDDIRIFLKECRSLARHGHEVTLVVADGLGDEVREGVAILDAGSSRGRLSRMFKTTQRVYRKAVELDADVYHLHDPELLPTGLRLKRRGKKVVFDAHEDVPQQLLGKHYLHPVMRRILSWGFARFERHACARFDGVVTATPHIRDKFTKIHPRSVDVNNFPMLGELESAVPWQDKANEVCYIGSIAQIRGIKELVRAMEATHPSVRLNLVGGFAEAQVEAEVRTYPGWGKVHALGVQDRRGVREVLGRSMAGVVTLHPIINYLDALPIKMFEYMSAGIPVIASNFPLWQQILESADCGVCVDPLDPLAIAKAIDEVVADPGRAEQMGQNGRRLIESKFNWSNEEAKLIEFYGLLLSS